MSIIQPDLHALTKKVADRQSLTEDEVMSLIRAVRHYQYATAYLASCHAATAEGLPRSASLSAMRRHHSICTKAAELMEGRSPPSHDRWPYSLDHEIGQCNRAAQMLGGHIAAKAASKLKPPPETDSEEADETPQTSPSP